MPRDKGTSSHHRTKRSQIVADQLATVLFTIMGLGVVAAVIGMVVFFTLTILPLFEGVNLRPFVRVATQEPVAAFTRDPDAPLLVAALDKQSGCALRAYVAEEEPAFEASQDRFLEDFGLTWPSGAGDGANPLAELQIVPSGGTDPSYISCKHIENSVFLATDNGPLKRQALVKLSLSREFIRDDELGALGPEVLTKLNSAGWTVIGRKFYAKASPEAPVSLLSPAVSTIAQWQMEPTVGASMSSIAPLALEWDDATYSGIGRVASDERSLLSIRSGQVGNSGLYMISQKENLVTGISQAIVEYRTLPPRVDRVIKLAGDQGIALVSDDGRLLVVPWDDMLLLSRDDVEEKLRKSSINLVPSGAAYVSVASGFGGNTVVVLDDSGRCTGYDLAYFALNSDVSALKTRWQSRCLAPTDRAMEIIGSPSQRLILLRNETNYVRGLDLTAGEIVTEVQLGSVHDTSLMMQFEKNGRYLLAQSDEGFVEWGVDSEHLQGSLRRLFGRIHYEGYESPSLSWQSASASDDFESKFSLWPLIWGTLKATLYAMLFAAPLGIAAAVYSSEMLDRRTRNFVKPSIEMMASLPSVVLGYLAAIVLAPWIEANILGVILCGLVVPCMLYFIGNVVADYSAKHVSGRGLYANRRLLIIILSGFIGSVLLLFWIGKQLEDIAFAGDLKAYLSGGEGSAGVIYGILFLPLVLFGLWSIPVSKRFGKTWKNVVIILGPAVSMLFGYFLHDDLGSASLEVAGYSQRNALVICVAMGFAIIPIIYSLSEDALTSVPGSLRAGSLACGASVWQTTARVVLPTAASGIFSALMVGFGRAIGETMIVVMATGNSPVMSVNPFEGLRTLAANIAVELPEAPVGGTHYRILFFSGFVLFLLTFCLNTFAEVMRTRYRKRNKAL